MTITIEVNQYDEFEQKAKRSYPNRIIEAFQPEAFKHVGYPTRIDSYSSLYRYADVMHECGFEGIFDLFLKGLSKEEFELVKEITNNVMELTSSGMEKCVIPRASLFYSLISLRNIRAIFPSNDVTILEIGPGSGYLGGLLGLLGYNYISTDVCQAMYLWQNALFNKLFGDSFIELADKKYDLNSQKKLSGGTNLHITWWKFASPLPENVNLNVDCIVCVDAITELNVFAMRYLGRQSTRWFNFSPGNKVFYVQGTGQQFNFSMIDVIGAFNLMGLDCILSDNFGLPEKYFPTELFHFFTPKNRPFKKNSGNWFTDQSLKASIIENRNIQSKLINVELFEILDFHQAMSNHRNNETDDELFWNFCNGKEWKWY